MTCAPWFLRQHRVPHCRLVATSESGPALDWKIQPRLLRRRLIARAKASGPSDEISCRLWPPRETLCLLIYFKLPITQLHYLGFVGDAPRRHPINLFLELGVPFPRQPLARRRKMSGTIKACGLPAPGERHFRLALECRNGKRTSQLHACNQIQVVAIITDPPGSLHVL